MTMNKGFTLIELLVVISIIGILASVLLANFVGVRGRASDTKLKNDLRQLKSALRLYYNDYQRYPATLSGPGSFTVSGTVYMKELPIKTDGTSAFTYYSDGNETFLLEGTLENVSDADVAASQSRCSPTSRSYYSGSVGTGDYFVCED